MSAVWTLIVIYGGLELREPARVVVMVSKSTRGECEGLARETQLGTGYTAYCAYVPERER